MKTLKPLSPLVLALALITVNACSSVGKSSTSSQDIAQTGPTILDVKTNPGTFSLNQNLQPTSQAQIYADVKDFQGKVTDVRLRFLHVPLEVPMKQLTPSTWVADLSKGELKQLAVNGHTMSYDANVIAKDNRGMSAVSRNPVSIQVKAPDLTG